LLFEIFPPYNVEIVAWSENVISPDVADVYITEELMHRAAPEPDYLREKLALQDLARQMVDHPAEVLPHLVDLSIEICNAIAGGISLYDKSAQVFRWHYLRGSLAQFEGATTPRHYSPCGTTLDLNKPTLVQRPERAYSWLVDANVSLAECLLVPLYLGGSEPLGTLWIVSENEGHFNESHSKTLTELAGFAGIALQMVRTETMLQEALDQQEVLTQEIGHRVKNLFAITDGMIRMTARNSTSPDEMAKSLSGRLHALAGAHGLVMKAFNQKGSSTEADFGELLKTILLPHQRSSIAFDGPPVQLGEKSTTSLALIFHELATNAAKYGALSSDHGTINVAWRTDEGHLLIDWQETGGPTTTIPQKKGFGSTLSATTINRHGGTISYDWKPEGLFVSMRVPIDNLAR
jgi:two-component sensor histidine kinase